MKIEYYHWVGHEEDYAALNPDTYKVRPMKELLSKLYDITNTAPYLEVEWDGKVEKVASSCYFKDGTDIHDFRPINDLKRRINDFPKNGPNGELCLHISMTIAYGN